MSITFCKFSFSPINRLAAPCAAANPPETPESPLISPCIPRWSCANMLDWSVASFHALAKRAASSCICRNSSVLRFPSASICTNASRHLRNCVSNDCCALALLSAASRCLFSSCSSFISASACFSASLITCWRRLISLFSTFCCAVNVRYSSSRPSVNAFPALLPNSSYCFCRSFKAVLFSSSMRSIVANPDSITAAVASKALSMPLPFFTASVLNF